MNAAALANLTDDEARQLEGTARAYYRRALILMNETGCDIRTALLAVEAADKEHTQ